jgi:hypothetical protein
MVKFLPCRNLERASINRSKFDDFFFLPPYPGIGRSRLARLGRRIRVCPELSMFFIAWIWGYVHACWCQVLSDI